MYLKFGSRPVIVVSSPSAVEECLSSKNDIIFANRPRFLIGKLLGHDYTTMVWADYGPNWKNLRRISAVELLSPSRLQMLSAMRFDEVKSIIKRLSDQGCKHQNVELSSKFFALTYNVIMRMMAGKRYYGEQVGDSEEVKRFQELVRETLRLSDSSNVGDFLPIWRWIGGDKGFQNEMLGLKAKRDKFLEDLLEEHRRLRSDLKFDREEKQTPLIQVLLSLQEAEPEHYTDDVVKGIMWDLFAAGTDTSKSTMEWAMSLLLNNPHVLKKAQEEIDLHVEPGRLLDESDVEKLPYVHSIVMETLRMYPPGPLMIPHEASEECIVGGYNVPRGTMLLVNLWEIENDPNLWNEPTKFVPERFLGLEGTRVGFKLMPFGVGRRKCPGEGLATRVITLTLAALIHCFDWERVGEQMVDMSQQKLGATMHKALPLEAKCRPRKNALNFIDKL
ncbi:hypothetical protein IFM89_007911 [Coptis chinensis]|uniref:Cytochrome P450 n=1 Tax=Coptis chinensis TaxID=261450 RepID=A0A835IKM4_9MAGN|nr:hypothetical protein IFM89_007911 [Coptis chinensis]